MLICQPGHQRNNGFPDCGWGCLVNHLLLCFLYAFASHRMLLFDSKSFGLGPFKPISDTCNFRHLPETRINWPASEDKIVNFMPYANKVDTGIYTKVVFPVLPAELIEVLQIITPDPDAWFAGQFLAYLLRPNEGIDSANLCPVHLLS